MSQATSLIVVSGIPEDGKTLKIGQPESETTAPVTFEFAARQPESENFWINTAKKPIPDHIEPLYTVAEMAQIIKAALTDHADVIDCDIAFDEVDSLTPTVRTDGEIGNSYVLETDSDALTITGFSGGSD